MNARRSVITIALLAAAGRGWSQPIYRCGSSYSDNACAGGRTIESDDPRTHAQAKQTEAAVRSDARLAREMESQRLRAEALAERSRVTSTNATRRARPAWTEAEDEDWPPEPGERGASGYRDPRAFTARVPGPPTRKKVKRSAAAKSDPAPSGQTRSPAPVR